MPKDTKTLGNSKARACESLGFVHKKGCARVLTHLPERGLEVRGGKGGGDSVFTKRSGFGRCRTQRNVFKKSLLQSPASQEMDR